MTEARDDRGRWIGGGGGAAPAKAPPSEDEKITNAINGALGNVDPSSRAKLEAYLRNRGQAALTDLMKALDRYQSVPTDRLKSALKLDTLSPSDIDALRRAMTAVHQATTLENAKAASSAVADAMKSLGPYRIARSVAAANSAAEAVHQQNIKGLARIIKNEVGLPSEVSAREPVGHTVMNRMARNQTPLVSDVAHSYTKGTVGAPPDIADLAKKLLDGSLPDSTGGATHFYQPKAMPKEGDVTSFKFDKSGGLESVPGVEAQNTHTPIKNYRPSWSIQFPEAHVPSVPQSVGKFYIQPGDGHVF